MDGGYYQGGASDPPPPQMKPWTWVFKCMHLYCTISKKYMDMYKHDAFNISMNFDHTLRIWVGKDHR